MISNKMREPWPKHGCTKVFLVEDIERRQADVRDFLLTKNVIATNSAGVTTIAARITNSDRWSMFYIPTMFSWGLAAFAGLLRGRCTSRSLLEGKSQTLVAAR